MPICCDCNQSLAKTEFSKNQLRKDPNSRRCKACVEALTLQEEADPPTTSKSQEILLEESLPVTEEKEIPDAILVEQNKRYEHEIDPHQKLNCVEVASKPDDVSSCTEQSSIVKPYGGGGLLFTSPKDEMLAVEFLTGHGQDVTSTIQQQQQQVDHGDLTNEVMEEKKEGTDPLEEIPNLVAVPSITLVVPNCEDDNNIHNVEKEEVTLVLDDNKQQEELMVLTATEYDHQDEVPVAPDSTTCHKTGVTEDSLDQSSSNRVRVGICAMDKKARSKPMGEILNRLDKELFEIVYFGDDVILNAPVGEWPMCDVLIAFYSSGYPLGKAEAYAELRKPFLLNDLKMQRVLQDRRRVYDLLEASGIDVPRHVFMNRDGYVSHNSSNSDSMCGDGEEDELVEHDDHIEVNGVVIHKPFVEKPVDADDHNLAIYYPTSAGGGCKKLFRKVGDRSSCFYPDINEIRREGSYIYEEFVETQGTDVKMYTVGPDYGHAEARKSPTVDGKVERNEDGKEVRFPVILTLREKEIARRIVIVFKQLVCGFDLLRVQEGDSLVSYVCDVNGWSFVKNSRKYYDDCAQLLTEHMLAVVKPKALHGFSALDPLMKTIKDFSVTTPRKKRHKSFSRSQSTTSQRSIDSCPSSPVRDMNDIVEDADFPSGQGAAATLEEGAIPVREMPNVLVNNPATMSATSSVNGDDDTQTTITVNEKSTTGTHQEELRCVIAVIRHGDRTPKQKLKINMSEPLLLEYFHKHSNNCRKDLKIKAKKPMTEFLECVLAMIAQKEAECASDNITSETRDVLYKLRYMRDVLERWKISGLNRKLQLKPRKWDEFIDEEGKQVLRCAELQLILKWGGNLTKLGEKQAISLGERFRNNMYPNTPGGGILRLHSTFRHDMKIKTSDEGRVMKTAAAFAKGLLELEGSIPPILVSLVHKEKDSLHMLDPSGNKEVKVELEACKHEVNKHLQQDFDIDKVPEKELEAAVGPAQLTSLRKALGEVKNPRKTLFAIRDTIGELLDQLDEMLNVMASDVENTHEGGEGLVGEDDDDEALSGIKLYKGETLLELTERWRLLHIKLYDEDKDEFDLSRVPDVHDNVRFDMLHNPHLGLTSTLEKLYKLAKVMADCVVPQEYGRSIEEKRSIGNKMCHALLDKIKYDLIIARTDNQVDMRYMINMDYSADLPINTMGRRIRTRLYFTSESHLHTLLNVLRFPSKAPGAKKSPLSRRGVNIISSAPELCYLTQVIIRLFENKAKDTNDPKRFRIEILFSPGASATPLHVSEMKRDADASRFDTEPLQLISSDYLTCQEVEDYFSQSIKEGKPREDETDVVSAIPTQTQSDVKIRQESKGNPKENNTEASGDSIQNQTESPQENGDVKEHTKTVTIAENRNVEFEPESFPPSVNVPCETITCENPSVVKEGDSEKEGASKSIEMWKLNTMTKILSKQFFWTSIATVSFVFGIGFIILSREVVEKDVKMKRWARR